MKFFAANNNIEKMKMIKFDENILYSHILYNHISNEMYYDN